MEKIIISERGRVLGNKNKASYNLDTVFYKKNSYYLLNLKKLYICYELSRVKSNEIDSLKNVNHKAYLNKIEGWASVIGIKIYDLKLSICDFDKILQLYILKKFYCTLNEKQDKN